MRSAAITKHAAKIAQVSFSARLSKLGGAADWCLVGESGLNTTLKSPELALRQFDPSVNKNGGVRKRRRIDVEVTPLGIKGFWEGAPLDPAFVSWETVEEQSLSILKDMPRAEGAKLEPIAAKDSRRGGLGIYVQAATAVFHNVTIRPLP
jgi:hypothetical protein